MIPPSLDNAPRKRQGTYVAPSFVPNWGWPEAFITARCLLTGRIVRGNHPGRYAEAVRRELGLRFALPVNRARFAIQLALRAKEIGDGDDVVLPSYVCEAALEPILNVGARPVFADAGPDLHLTVETALAAITPKTRCIIVPHLYGNTAPIDEIEAALKDSPVFVIDDAAQSFGARRANRPVGSFGLCGVVGCGPGKSLGGAAGGLLVTNDPQLYERAAAAALPRERVSSVLRRVGAFWTWFRFRKYFLRFKGVSDRVLSGSDKTGDRPGRMANMDAMLVLQQYRCWSRNAALRRADAQRILRALGPCSGFSVSDLTPSGVVLRVVLVLPEGGPSATEAIDWLDRVGVEAWPGYGPLHRSTAGAAACPLTESLAGRVLLLPISYKRDRRRERALERFRDWLCSRSGSSPEAQVVADRSGSRVALS